MEYSAYADANAVDEAHEQTINNAHGQLENKYLDKLPAVIEKLRGAGVNTNTALSRYIVDNRLGEQLPETTGIVTMSDGRDTWAFEGGVSPQLYRVLCKELGLIVPKSGIQARSFDTYTRRYG